MQKRVYSSPSKTLLYNKCEILRKKLKQKDKNGILVAENGWRKFMFENEFNSFDEYLNHLYDKLVNVRNIDAFDPYETLCRRYREFRLQPTIDRLVRIDKVPPECLDRVPEFAMLYSEVNSILKINNEK